jgi:hypothetical protein
MEPHLPAEPVKRRLTANSLPRAVSGASSRVSAMPVQVTQHPELGTVMDLFVKLVEDE